MRLGRQETIPQYTASPETEVTAKARAENACLTLKVPLGMFSSMSGVIFSQYYENYPHVSRVHLFSMRQGFPSNYFCFDVCVPVCRSMCIHAWEWVMTPLPAILKSQSTIY